MRLVTYSPVSSSASPTPRLGVRVGHRVLDVEMGSRVDGEPLPSSLRALLREGRGASARVHALAKAAQVNAGRYSGAMLEERAIHFLPPVPDPGRFELVRMGSGAPEVTSLASHKLVGHAAQVARGPQQLQLSCKPHLVFVIGRLARKLDADAEPFDYVAGVTFLHELTGAPAMALGPELVTLDEAGDPDDLWFTCTVNGHQRIRRSANGPLGALAEVLALLTANAPLEPGDMVAIELADEDLVDLVAQPGDVVESSIGRVTTLRTTIVGP